MSRRPERVTARQFEPADNADRAGEDRGDQMHRPIHRQLPGGEIVERRREPDMQHSAKIRERIDVGPPFGVLRGEKNQRMAKSKAKIANPRGKTGAGKNDRCDLPPAKCGASVGLREHHHRQRDGRARSDQPSRPRRRGAQTGAEPPAAMSAIKCADACEQKERFRVHRAKRIGEGKNAEQDDRSPGGCFIELIAHQCEQNHPRQHKRGVRHQQAGDINVAHDECGAAHGQRIEREEMRVGLPRFIHRHVRVAMLGDPRIPLPIPA